MNTATQPVFAVVGGGITGLTAARVLERELPTARVILYEADSRVGGKIFTEPLQDTAVENGADSFLAREPWAVDLCRSLGIQDDLVKPAVYGAQIWTGKQLKPLPPGFLRGIPSSVGAARRSGLLSPPGVARTAADYVFPGPLGGADVSLGAFVRRRFGVEVLERLVDPVLAGTRAGAPDQISLAAAAPEIDRIARRHRSVMRGLARVRSAGRLETGPPPFLSVRDGMQEIVDRLRWQLKRTEVYLHTPVRSLKTARRRYRLETSTGAERVDAVLLAVPAPQAANILKSLSSDAATRLQQIEYASVAAISLLYRDLANALPPGSGLLVPSSAKRTISACTWFSRKWPHLTRESEGTVVRGFVGRRGREEVLERDDDDLVRLVCSDLKRSVGLAAPPYAARVTRWEAALPQYAIGHLDLVRRVEHILADERIALAGAGYRGSGIPDCVRQGVAAAERLIAATVGLAS